MTKRNRKILLLYAAANHGFLASSRRHRNNHADTGVAPGLADAAGGGTVAAATNFVVTVDVTRATNGLNTSSFSRLQIVQLWFNLVQYRVTGQGSFWA
jgi:hypothetical protein